MWAEALINPLLMPVRTVEQSSLLSGGARFLWERSLLNISILSIGIPSLGLVLFKNMSSMALPLRGEVAWDDVDCHTDSLHNIFPLALGALHRAGTLLRFVCDLILYDLLCVHVPYLWHMTIFDAIVVSFKCPTFTPLGYVGGHNHAYDFLSNHGFDFVIPRLESHCSSSLGSSF